MKAANELRAKERAELMYDLTISICSPNLSQDDLNSYVKMWKDLANDAVPEFKKEQVSYTKSGRPVIPFDQATKIMFDQLRVKKRLEGHG